MHALRAIRHGRMRIRQLIFGHRNCRSLTLGPALAFQEVQSTGPSGHGFRAPRGAGLSCLLPHVWLQRRGLFIETDEHLRYGRGSVCDVDTAEAMRNGAHEAPKVNAETLDRITHPHKWVAG